jgi:transposase
VTDRALVFNFRIPYEQPTRAHSVGIDLNMPSADFATSDGLSGSVDLTPITRVQGAMARKRVSIQRRIQKDLRHQRAVVRRHGRRERNRVRPLLHRAANELLARVGERNVVFEDLSKIQAELLKESKRPKRSQTEKQASQRRRLSVWTQGELQRIVSYKSPSWVVRVSARGTSSECPGCGGPLAHPSWRRATCGHCQSEWHRDRAAAIVVLSRGQPVLRGEAPPPSARDALLEAARWRPTYEAPSGLLGEPGTGDDAKLGWTGSPD